MDAPDVPAEAHRQALRGLARVNRLSFTARVLWRFMQREAMSRGRLDVLDLACGGGDLLIEFARRARKNSIEFRGLGGDVSATAIAHAKEAGSEFTSDGRSVVGPHQELKFVTLDCLRDPLPSGFDFVMCSLFLHHLDEAAATQLLARMRDAAGRKVLVDDLRRCRGGWALAWLGTRLLSRSRIVHVDGPQSVRAAFSVAEMKTLAEESGLTKARLTRHWPYRMLLSWTRL